MSPTVFCQNIGWLVNGSVSSSPLRSRVYCGSLELIYSSSCRFRFLIKSIIFLKDISIRFLGCSVNFPSIEYLIRITAGHLHQICSALSSFYIHSRHFDSSARLILFMWRLRLQWPVSSPIKILRCNLLSSNSPADVCSAQKLGISSLSWYDTKIFQSLFVCPGRNNIPGRVLRNAEYLFISRLSRVVRNPDQWDSAIWKTLSC